MVVHRDVKPDNIGFTAEGDLKLLDLGLSKVVSKSEMDNAAYIMTGGTGSARYMAPEVCSFFQHADVVGHVRVPQSRANIFLCRRSRQVDHLCVSNTAVLPFFSSAAVAACMRELLFPRIICESKLC